MRYRVLILWLVGSLVACAGGSPKTAYYTLSSTEVAKPVANKQHIKSVGISRVQIPDLLKRSQMVLRKQGYQVDVSDTYQWGGDLRDELTNALVQQLQVRLPATRIQTAPWELEQTPQYEFSLQVSQFDGALNDKAYLKGRWQLLRGASDKLVEAGTVDLVRKVEGDTVGDIVKAQNALIGQLVDLWVSALPKP
ncbi:PqiC family protein [Thiolinea disciformis]|uniref:PqiC family protein n=1 Tax=Thiolinea disciformis TaxID=125614 RepID=UPI000372B8CD|nr:PqiC family protein [Thiolinea disciformis]